MNELEINISPDYSELKGGKLYLTLDIKIDGKNPLMSSNDDDFDIYELLNSWYGKDKNETYFIFTCSCGVPGCVGYFKGVSIKKSTNLIYWKDLDQDYSYCFIRSKYREKVARTAKEVLGWKKYANNRKLHLHIYPEWNDIEKVIELSERLS